MRCSPRQAAAPDAVSRAFKLETKSRKAALAGFASIPLRLLIKLSLRAAQDFQSLSVMFKLRETGRILLHRQNRVKKKLVRTHRKFGRFFNGPLH